MPALDPTPAAPVNVVDVLGAAGVPIVREDEDNLAAERSGDLVLILQNVLSLLLALMGVHLLGAADHHVALHELLVSLEEAEDIVGATAEGHLDRESSLDALGQEFLEQGPIDRVGEREELVVVQVVDESGKRTRGCISHSRASFCSVSSTSNHSGQKEVLVFQPSY
ncbi:MAG: hypothetical protein A2563_04655 [Candidatus Magasanikbacteria bacterium RIFOXYD1_FULL_40_23]|uniref:Uncharacterized protein n=1 Tax=Candidatus Magasanikbacteria bacterium RIFOXYD1_FULL_40_23 TaxID=1798705 RepID=A0A1F6PAI0_9BACT|nr:MAG: hypothetical protein A2563_04655 [Candidatus Magasanikbacteria bacterium RIFOXYD1_FULL_40_23]